MSRFVAVVPRGYREAIARRGGGKKTEEVGA